MTSRITSKTLDAIAARLNKITNSPAEPYTRTAEGKLQANIGNFHISGAYGGYALYRMVNTSGGVSDVFNCGHMKARELADRMYAYERGIELAAANV
jgi:hypothetical protein